VDGGDVGFVRSSSAFDFIESGKEEVKGEKEESVRSSSASSVTKVGNEGRKKRNTAKRPGEKSGQLKVRVESEGKKSEGEKNSVEEREVKKEKVIVKKEEKKDDVREQIEKVLAQTQNEYVPVEVFLFFFFFLL